MANESTNRKYWYLVRLNKDRHACYNLVYAESEDMAIKRVGFCADNTIVVIMSPRGMRELTGCIVSRDAGPDDLATGALLFYRNDRRYSIHA